MSKSIFNFAFTWLLRINRICQKLKFYSIKVIVIDMLKYFDLDPAKVIVIDMLEYFDLDPASE